MIDQMYSFPLNSHYILLMNKFNKAIIGRSLLLIDHIINRLHYTNFICLWFNSRQWRRDGVQ